MTKKELLELKVGTLIYNGRVEGEIMMYGGEKCIEIIYPINSMHDSHKDYNERPDNWMVLYDEEEK